MDNKNYTNNTTTYLKRFHTFLMGGLNSFNGIENGTLLSIKDRKEMLSITGNRNKDVTFNIKELNLTVGKLPKTLYLKFGFTEKKRAIESIIEYTSDNTFNYTVKISKKIVFNIDYNVDEMSIHNKDGVDRNISAEDLSDVNSSIIYAGKIIEYVTLFSHQIFDVKREELMRKYRFIGNNNMINKSINKFIDYFKDNKIIIAKNTQNVNEFANGAMKIYDEKDIRIKFNKTIAIRPMKYMSFSLTADFYFSDKLNSYERFEINFFAMDENKLKNIFHIEYNIIENRLRVEYLESYYAVIKNLKELIERLIEIFVDFVNNSNQEIYGEVGEEIMDDYTIKEIDKPELINKFADEATMDKNSAIDNSANQSNNDNEFDGDIYPYLSIPRFNKNKRYDNLHDLIDRANKEIKQEGINIFHKIIELIYENFSKDKIIVINDSFGEKDKVTIYPENNILIVESKLLSFIAHINRFQQRIVLRQVITGAIFDPMENEGLSNILQSELDNKLREIFGKR